ncbi:Amino acid transporter [Rasamsonia emersonii CBS 393.64]|uniref:Amino acid transporter n=1 Tax=Rasamsonia emersonii (strain ATCC 16479 / CBS 393.64 / IMI 116815) TaxID=1408163 RepID=A0A0F4YLM6_RASE3|nr:Amino acid transporter [Rasamsonia emersonii CBS 393.64]KKA18756.1 Amino acid transporter [Rasamsonia emersonii CBS 393.64]
MSTVARANSDPGLLWSLLQSTFATFVTIAELASMAPTSGGQYHWVSMLAPSSAYKFLSYITGWATVAGWQASLSSASYLSATLIQGLIKLTHPGYNMQPWHGTLLYWAIIAFTVFINVISSGLLPKFEGLILVLHILGFFAILIPLAYLAEHSPPSAVFNSWLNEGDYQTQTLSFFVGIVGNVFAFSGADAAVHMSEEIQNASRVVPTSIITTIVINGSLGLGMILTVLFSLGNVEKALKSPTGYPFMEIFLEATESVAGSTVMASIITILGLCATVGGMASASRMIWSFSRDRGIPGWKILSRLDPRTSIPVWSIATTTTIACLLALINLGSSVAFNDVISLSVAGLYSSYLICCSLLLWRRCTNQILIRSDSAGSQLVNTPGATLTWGPFRIPGIFGIIVNSIAVIYLIIAIFFSFWPTKRVVTVESMNYSSVGYSSVVIISVVYYFVRARKVYTGPVIEIDPQ